MQTLAFWLTVTLFLHSNCRSMVRALVSRQLVLQWSPFRKLLSTLHQGSSGINEREDPLQLAQNSFSLLARSNKSWKRLGHLVDLGCRITTPVSSIADIGCDHGLLTVGLAVSGKFERVVGADVSPLALENAVSLQRELDARPGLDLNIEFRLGDGMAALGDSEIDVVCLAGMGGNTMKSILTEEELDRVGCQHILIQPTNSRPRNLCKLYDYLQDMGWCLCDERIEYLSSRWYISTRFSRNETITVTQSSSCCNTSNALPGSCLELLSTSDLMSHAYSGYVNHHISWLKRDLQVTQICEEEKKWLLKAKEYKL
jgi:tRNA A22 N-methylase